MNFQKMAFLPVVLFSTLLSLVYSSTTPAAGSSSEQALSTQVSSFGSVMTSAFSKPPSSPVSLLVFASTGPDTSLRSVSGHKTSSVGQTIAVAVKTSIVTGQTSIVISQTNAVTDRTTIVTDQTSPVIGQTIVVTSQTSIVTNQTSVVTGQTNIVTGQTSIISSQTFTVSSQSSTVNVQGIVASPIIGQTSIVTNQTDTVSGQTSTVADQTSTVKPIAVSSTRASPVVSASVPTDVNPCKRNNGGCAHYCSRLNKGYKCSCSSGFELNADQQTCTEIDECNSAIHKHKCAHICVNTLGSFACACHTGHKLESDGLTCKEVPTSSPSEAASSSYGGWVVFGVAVAFVLLSIVLILVGVISKRVVRNREKREISGVRELTEINTSDPVAETIEIEP